MKTLNYVILDVNFNANGKNYSYDSHRPNSLMVNYNSAREIREEESAQLAMFESVEEEK